MATTSSTQKELMRTLSTGITQAKTDTMSSINAAAGAMASASVDPTVPTSSGLKWEKDSKIAKLTGPTTEFRNTVKSALVMLDGLEAQSMSIRVSDSTISTLEKQNTNLINAGGMETKNIKLNNRKTFYETAQINVVKNMYNIIFIAYWIIYATLILIVLFTRNYRYFNRYKLLSILIALTIFPFITIYISRIIYSFINIYSTLISKNIYNKP